MKKLYIFGLAILLVGCEKEFEVKISSNNKSYFACIDYEFDPNVESVLYIDHNKKIIKVAGKEWKNYSQDEQQIFGKEQGDGYDNTVQFNFVTGKLNITMSNYFKESSMMAKHNGVKTFYYQCRKTESML
tara:strand:+ start:551 stop:940 length:390 start_codon:yes stop_codon:yes gene_type:complete